MPVSLGKGAHGSILESLTRRIRWYATVCPCTSPPRTRGELAFRHRPNSRRARAACPGYRAGWVRTRRELGAYSGRVRPELGVYSQWFPASTLRVVPSTPRVRCEYAARTHENRARTIQTRAGTALVLASCVSRPPRRSSVWQALTVVRSAVMVDHATPIRASCGSVRDSLMQACLVPVPKPPQ